MTDEQQPARPARAVESAHDFAQRVASQAGLRHAAFVPGDDIGWLYELIEEFSAAERAPLEARIAAAEKCVELADAWNADQGAELRKVRAERAAAEARAQRAEAAERDLDAARRDIGRLEMEARRFSDALVQISLVPADDGLAQQCAMIAQEALATTTPTADPRDADWRRLLERVVRDGDPLVVADTAEDYFERCRYCDAWSSTHHEHSPDCVWELANKALDAAATPARGDS